MLRTAGLLDHHLGAMRDTDEKGPKKFLRLRRGGIAHGREFSNRQPPRKPVTDPREMVRTNVERERRAGLYHVQPMRTRRKRRGFDFLALCVAGNSLAAGVMVWIEASVPTLLITGSGMLFFTLVLGWLMFVQHDEY
jgi:hypothetical protein